MDKFGVWAQTGTWAARIDDAAWLEELGYGTLWVGGSPDADLHVPEYLLDASKTINVATGIVNVWTSEPEDVSHSFQRIGSDRLFIGIGAGHRQVNQGYEKPYARLESYLDRLEVPVDKVLLAALGPKVLGLAASRTAGAHPYLVPVEHTAAARAILGDKLLAPEVTVVVEDDPATARAIARKRLEIYLSLTNYTGNWRRYGFEDADFADGGSDRLVDTLFAWGTPDQVAARLREHLVAGADHVAIQFLNGHHAELAAALLLRSR
ncbi:TIGR03620 family F420-dependent LLM class oxidoreductase [Lentzea aerocolonigenes]|uniref:TIGR03620 family F420-dependent LLM class oxidoreductase n=1 Tax=Lentzea aerocolonigenes TaxID=68170 RepID=UPI000695E891|nr:TIGR03620 family F420-dependent LLM class oxidoreductase [Lentzea aerocolonigenes]